MLNPSKTTSPNKLFDYVCVTLYMMFEIGKLNQTIRIFHSLDSDT